jgi:hypothetical protein
MNDPMSADSMSTQTHDAHGKAPCACEQQTLGAVPWMVVVLLALLAWQYMRARKSRGGAGGDNEAPLPRDR